MNEAADIGRDLIVIFVLVMVFAWVFVLVQDDGDVNAENSQDSREVLHD
jgi:hypothetical protein